MSSAKPKSSIVLSSTSLMPNCVMLVVFCMAQSIASPNSILDITHPCLSLAFPVNESKFPHSVLTQQNKSGRKLDVIYIFCLTAIYIQNDPQRWLVKAVKGFWKSMKCTMSGDWYSSDSSMLASEPNALSLLLHSLRGQKSSLFFFEHFKAST